MQYRRMYLRLLAFTAAAFLSFPTTVPAAGIDRETPAAVTVIGEEELAIHNRIPGTVNTVSAEQIANLKPLDVTQVIRRIPGVNYIDEDGRGLKPNIALRGLDPNRSRNVLLLLDGFPIQPSSFGDPAAYYNVPIEDIERIDVIKGPSSLLYHANSLGGVINYISKEPPADKKVEFVNRETFGEDSLFHSQSVLGGTVDDVSYRVSYLRKQGEGFRESDAYGIHDVNTYLKYRIDDQSEIVWRNYVYTEESDTPGGLSRAQYDADHLQSNTPDDNFEGRRFHTNLTYRNNVTENQTFEAYFYYTFLERNWYIASTQTSGNQQFLRDFNVFGFGARHDIFYDLFWMEQNSLTFGVDFYFDSEDDLTVRGPVPTATSGTRTGDNDLSAFSYSLYATTNLQATDRLSIAPVLRMDFVRNELENNITGIEGHNTITAWSPGVGISYDLLETTELYASFHRSFQPGEYKESVSLSTGLSQDFDPQHGTHFEIGVNSDPLPWMETNLALFTFDFDNEVINQGGQFVNGRETRHNGIEGVLALNLVGMTEGLTGTDLPEYLGELSTDFNFTFLDTDVREGASSGNELPYAPSWQFNWGLQYDHPTGFYANLYAQFVDEQFSNVNNSRVENAAGSTGIIPSYKVWDFNAGYDWNDTFGVFFGVRNLFDEKYFTRRETFFTGITPSPDRQVYFGVKMKIG